MELWCFSGFLISFFGNFVGLFFFDASDIIGM